MTTEERLMEQLKKEWSRKGDTERYIYFTDLDYKFLNLKIQKKVKEYEQLIKQDGISFDRYLKAVRECFYLCRLLETIQMGRQSAKVCPLDREEYEIYKNLLFYDN